LDEQLGVQKEVKERRCIDEELVMVGVDVEFCDAGHPGGDERGWVDGLHVNDCHVIIISKEGCLDDLGFAGRTGLRHVLRPMGTAMQK
jgi:hypothetical protein